MKLKLLSEIQQLTPTELIQYKHDMAAYRKELLNKSTEFAYNHMQLIDEMRYRIDSLIMEELLTEDERINNFQYYDLTCRIH